MDANRKLLDTYVERYNQGDLDGVMALYAEDAVQGMPDGTFYGWSAIRERLAMELAACPDVVHTVRSFVGNGDFFADEWTFVGTHTGPFVLPDGTEVPPTGKRLEVQGMEVVAVRDGKIVLNTLYYDMMGVVVQMGLLLQGASA
jgi:steroid delta-isomerase-like uncharacterized protein